MKRTSAIDAIHDERLESPQVIRPMAADRRNDCGRSLWHPMAIARRILLYEAELIATVLSTQSISSSLGFDLGDGASHAAW